MNYEKKALKDLRKKVSRAQTTGDAIKAMESVFEDIQKAAKLVAEMVEESNLALRIDNLKRAAYLGPLVNEEGQCYGDVYDRFIISKTDFDLIKYGINGDIVRGVWEQVWLMSKEDYERLHK